MSSKSGGLVACILLLLAFLLPPCAGAVDLAIVAHPEIPESTIDNKDVQRIFLGKQTQWRDDTTIVPVMLKFNPLHDDFIERYVGRSVQRFVTYWRQMVFTGKGVPPKLFGSESELIEFVAATPGSVGFASRTAEMSGVKILLSD